MKKKYILKCYDDIIREIQRPQLFPELSIDERIQTFSAESEDFLSDQNENIIKHYREKIYSLKSKSKIEHFINAHHKAIGNLAAQLISKINAPTFVDLHTFNSMQLQVHSLKAIYNDLEKLVRYIEKEYDSYIDKNLSIPCISGLLIDEKAHNGLEHFQNHDTIEHRLFEITMAPITKLSRLTTKESLTYKEYEYSINYRSALQNLLKCDITLTNKELSIHLFSWNLNTLSLFDYETDRISNVLEKMVDPAEKLKVLYKEFKTYNQRPLPTGKCYDDTIPNIKQQIVGWIEEEIEYHLQTIKLETPAVNIPNENLPKGKLVSGMSVAQLSYTFNLLSQVGVINQNNHRDIFRFISENFKTNMTDKISVDSIKSKYYNVESSTKAAVREKMIAILNLTKL